MPVQCFLWTRQSITRLLQLITTPPPPPPTSPHHTQDSQQTYMSYYGHVAAAGGGTSTQAQQPSSPAAPAGGGQLDQGKIFVGGLSWSTTEESLRFHFEQYGPVENVQVMRDRNTGEPRGFGFVVFQDVATVDAVMEHVPIPGHEINHKLVDVKRAQARGQAPPSIHQNHQDRAGFQQQQEQPQPQHSRQSQDAQREPTPEELNNKVFVGGIPPNIDNEGLKEIFEQFGAVVDAIVMVDTVTGRSRCFGFVTFENGSNGAQKAIAVQPLSIQDRRVEVKLATPKEKQQQRGPPAAGSKHVGLRAGISSSSSGEYAGLAVAYGRNGWKAGYGTYAFGKAGWAVQGWEDIGVKLPERAGFSFDMLADLPSDENNNEHENNMPPPSKRTKH
jgi:RNA-binding protein Musashi